MSEPSTLRTQSERVANQFVLTARRIDRLKVFMQRPKDQPSDKRWLDKSILQGVDHLVDKALKRHLMPLYKSYEFPTIFDKGNALGVKDGDDENLTIREIKETNCMGALILLYYSLLWHMVPIVLNRKENPSGICPDDDIPTPPVLSGLLEQRGVAILLSEMTDAQFKSTMDLKLIDNCMIDPFCYPNETVPKRRISSAVRGFRKTLSIFHAVYTDDTSADVDLPDDSYLNCMTADCIISNMEMFGGVISTFNIQGDVSRWEDMYKVFEVQSNSEDEVNRNGVVYEYRLIDVLKAPPYHPAGDDDGFLVKAARCAIYDYGSVSLMVDISKSLLMLKKVLNGVLVGNDDGITFSEIACLQHYTINQRLETELKGYISGTRGRLERDKTKFHSCKYINLTPSWNRSVCTLDSALSFGVDSSHAFMIDSLAGLYWGCRPCGISDVNHQYLACPSIEMDKTIGSKMVYALQKLCKTHINMQLGQFVIEYVVSLHRNSLFVMSESKSLIMLIENLKRFAPTGLTTTMPPNRLYVDSDFTTFYTKFRSMSTSSGPSPSSVDPTQALNSQASPQEPNANNTKYSLCESKKALVDEVTVLQLRIDQAKSVNFQKYPGISWPVRYATGNNFNSFDEVRSMPKMTRSLQQSADTIADSFGFLNSHLAKEAREKIAAAQNGNLEAQNEINPFDLSNIQNAGERMAASVIQEAVDSVGRPNARV